MAKKFYAIRRRFDIKKNQVVENIIKTSWKEASVLVQGISQKNMEYHLNMKGLWK